MSEIVLIAGSPSTRSKSLAVLGYASELLNTHGLDTETIRIRDFDAEALLFAQFDNPDIQRATATVQAAQAIIIATPVYKAAYSGALKVFLDLLPQDAFAGKLVLPIATGGSLAHLLAIDYALKPVLCALGANHILSSIYIQDSQLHYDADLHVYLDDEVDQRLRLSLDGLVHHLPVPVRVPVTAKVK